MSTVSTTIAVVATHRFGNMEITFTYTSIGWRPELLRNHTTGHISAPPPCFKPNDALLEILNNTLRLQFSEALAPVGVYEPELN